MNFASFISQQRFLNFIATTLKTAFITIRFIAHSRLAMQKIECYVTDVLNVCRMKLTFYFLYYYYYYYNGNIVHAITTALTQECASFNYLSSSCR